jgi:ribonuclease R
LSGIELNSKSTKPANASVYFKEAKASNQLIEEFMLLANKRVAEFIGKPADRKSAPKTFVYRIHDRPDPEKLENFNHFIHKFGYTMQLGTPNAIAKSMNTLMENVRGKDEQNVIETLAVRTMAKAEYSTRNIGHYGLAFDYYTHFTSPIRRYPDVMVTAFWSVISKAAGRSMPRNTKKCASIRRRWRPAPPMPNAHRSNTSKSSLCKTKSGNSFRA